MLFLLFLPRPACAQTIDDGFWVTNGPVNTVVRDGRTIYIGGKFTRVSPASGCGVPLDASSGAPLTSFPMVTGGEILAVVPDGAGGWYIGGLFESVGGVARSNLAHIASDLSVSPWNPGCDSLVLALAVSGSTIYVGGQFSTIGGQPRSNIAALDATTGLATSWSPNADQWVNTLAVSGTTVYAGGAFTSIGGQLRSGIAALDANTGSATTWNPNASGYVIEVKALEVVGSTVYAGGEFGSIGGAGPNLAALDASTGLATDWNPMPNQRVNAIAVSGGTVYAGGQFTTIGGSARNRIAALDATTGSATAWNPDADGFVYSLRVLGSTVYAGGNFTSVGGRPRSCLASLDSATGIATTWNPDPNRDVQCLAIFGTTIYAGGLFTGLGGPQRNNIAALDVTTLSPTSWDPNCDNEVYSIVVGGAYVYACGYFGHVGVLIRPQLAQIEVASGLATSWNPGPLPPGPDAVRSMALYGSNLYVGGSFTSIGGQSRNRIAALDVTSGLATGWNPNAQNGTVRVLAVSDSVVYAGGSFGLIGGQTRHGLAAVNLSTGSVTAWNPNVLNPNVLALAVRDTIVYVGGGFYSVGSQPRYCLAAVGAAGGIATPWDPHVNGGVRALTLTGSTLYAGGDFDSVGGQPQGCAAAIDAASGAVLSWNPDLMGIYRDFDGISNPGVYGMATGHSAIYLGGRFYGAAYSAHSYLAKVTRLDAPPVVTAPQGAVGEETAEIAFVVTATDPDGDAIGSLTADLSALPAGHDATFAPTEDYTTGAFTWHPALGTAGLYQIVFTASNTLFASDTTWITVAPLGASITGTFRWTPTPADVGTRSVFFTAKDAAGDSATATTQITVSGPSPGTPLSSARAPATPLAAMKGPIISAPTTAQAVVGSPLEIVVVATNGATSLSADASDLPSGDTATFTVDREPAFLYAPEMWAAMPGALPVDFSVTAADPDGDPFALTADLSGLPPGNGATFSVSTLPDWTQGQFHWSPAAGDTGVFVVKFKAENSLASYAATVITVGRGLVGYWRLNGNLIDTALRNDFTSWGNVTYEPGVLNQAALIDGSSGGSCLDGYASYYHQIRASGFTAEMWVKVRSLEYGDNPILMQAGTDTPGDPFWRLAVCKTSGAPGHVLLTVTDYPRPGQYSWSLESNAAIDDDQWHHVAATYDGTALKLYIDGGLDNALADATVSSPVAGSPMRVGTFWIGSYVDQFDGWIDELRIWNVARTPSQLLTSMNQELGYPTGVEGEGAPRFADRLGQNRPNPFNPRTQIEFELKSAGHARLTVFDAQGRVVARLVDALRSAGRQVVGWDGTDAQGHRAASGVYFYRLESPGFTASRRMVLLR